MGAREKDLNPDIYIGLKLPLTQGGSSIFAQTKTTFEQAKHNIRNLLLTIPGERLGQPEFGSGLHELVFEQMDENFEDIIEASISNAIKTWLPYINIKNINFEYGKVSENQINVNIDFGLTFEPDRFESVKIDMNQFESQLKQ